MHASTQMMLTGPEGCAFLEQQGVSRVVLSRELSLEEIKRSGPGSRGNRGFCARSPLLLLFRPMPFQQYRGGKKRKQGKVRPALPPALRAFRGKRRPPTKYGALFVKPQGYLYPGNSAGHSGSRVFSLKIEGRMKRPEYTGRGGTDLSEIPGRIFKKWKRWLYCFREGSADLAGSV